MPISNQPTLTMSINGLSAPDHGPFDLINRLQATEFLDNPDRTVHLNQLSADNNLNIEIPNMGRFALTDWSKSQLSTLLGIRFDKWFENSEPQDQAFEMNRRFSRSDATVKLRTTIIGAGDCQNDGTLKAIVSPSFSAVQDSQVASMVIHSLSAVESELRIIRADITTRSTSFVVSVGRPFTPGGDNHIGSIFGGICLRNSGVGYASLSITLHVTRLICTNGMTVPIHGAEILHKRHTSGLTMERIQTEIGNKFQEIPGKLRQAGQILQSSRNIVIDNVEDTITRILQQAHLPRKLVQPLMVAYQREPHPSAFGIAQAISDNRTLNEIGLKPEERSELEAAAGDYLRSVTSPS